MCNRLWPYKTIVQPQMFSNELQFSFATVKHFHLKRFAIDGAHPCLIATHFVLQKVIVAAAIN